jgi:hypothetical protein
VASSSGDEVRAGINGAKRRVTSESVGTGRENNDERFSRAPYESQKSCAISRDVRLGISHAKKPLKVVHGLECHREGSAIDSFILT